jgi:ribosomal protein L14E/L6E/L27E
MGADEGKLVTVLDVVNQNRVLVEGENVQRMVIPVRRLSLTKFKINDVLRN